MLAKGAVQLKTDMYTGCTASVLIHKTCIPAVLRCLKDTVNSDGRLLPLDNQLRRLIQLRQLRFGRTAPFITGVFNESIEQSTIQERENDEHCIALTQQICANLRRQLSVLETNNPNGALIQLMQQLAQDRGQPSHKEMNRTICMALMQLAEAQGLLRYSLQPRLQGDPDNEQ